MGIDENVGRIVFSFARDTPWEEISHEFYEPFLALPPEKRGKIWADFVRSGCGVRTISVPDTEILKVRRIITNVRDLEEWQHPAQTIGAVKGHMIYDFLEKSKMLDRCINLTSLKLIQAKGPSFYRHYWAGKKIFAWKSVRPRSPKSKLRRAPFLCECGDKILLDYRFLDDNWPSDSPALMY
ncbi:hypothetical protein HY311_03915 [Candidatus Nomurabacteria bacterium]|nr:hypothetical protein [Candidatus Nomurabacteria bacterium]